MDWGSFGLGNLLGILVGGLISHRLALHRIKTGNVIGARNKFREVLIGSLTRSKTGYNEHQIVQAEFDVHYEAALNFSAYVNKRKRKKFEEDLVKYKMWNDIIGNKSREDRMYDNEDPIYKELDAMNPMDLISKLVSYSE